MQIQFTSISEPSLAGQKWLNLFSTHWEAYKKWILNNEKAVHSADLATCQEALKAYMPEMWSTYVHLCELVNADELAAKFLTGYRPPFYVSGCSNAVFKDEQIHLVRNYDHHPDLFEGVQLFTKWNRKKVIATSDCLMGVLDGINEDGLVVSLTFGGRKVIGEGFGIPFILRYILEFCSNVEEAVSHLTRIPSHMAYNVTLIDALGHHKTVRLAPGEKPVVTNATYTTNHQKKVHWSENAEFNNTLERSSFLKHLLKEKHLTKSSLVEAFLSKPLYNDLFNEGFGTLFTAAYTPNNGTVEMFWPGVVLKQSFDDFKEQTISVRVQQGKNANDSSKKLPYQNHIAKTFSNSNPNLNTEKPFNAEKNEFISEVWLNIQPESEGI